MYKAVFYIQPENIIEERKAIFIPFINCYEIHSIFIYVNGIAQTEEIDFNIYNNIIDWSVCDFHITSNDLIIIEINYFYIRRHDVNVLGFLVNSTYSQQGKSKEIISTHYIDGQFSLDNGLYKNAVLNFGTTLEGILNKTLTHKRLGTLIKEYSGKASKSDMIFIQDLRNKIHPEQIYQNQDISAKDAYQARNKLEKIIHCIFIDNSINNNDSIM